MASDRLAVVDSGIPKRIMYSAKKSGKNMIERETVLDEE